jgi:AhpD family alkylhydroperoxidase
MTDEKQGRIPMLEREQVPPELQTLFDVLLEQRGVVPYMFKTIANTPALALGIAAFLKPLLSDGALAGWYKELIATRVAILQNCDYWTSAHIASAKQKGASEPQVKGVYDPEHGPYTEREKIGFRLAERLHDSAERVDDAFYAELARDFNHREMIELVATAAAFEFFTRFVDALRIPTTPVPEKLPMLK